MITTAMNYFGLGQGIFFFGYGVKELAVDGIYQRRKIKPINENSSGFGNLIYKIRCALSNLFTAHGAMYTASAVCWTAAELDKLNYISLGAALPVVRNISNIIFVGACAVAIGYQVMLLKEAITMLKEGNEKEKQLSKYMIVSAVMGIVGNVGYIAAVVAMVVGAPLLAGILAGIAVTIGCIKVLYDYKRLSPALEQM